MAAALLAALEALAGELVERRWATRTGVVTDAAGVVAVGSTARRPAAPAAAPPEAADDARDQVARVVVEAVEGEEWVFVDLGPMRLLARVARDIPADGVHAWLAAQLRRLGVTIERAPLARE